MSTATAAGLLRRSLTAAALLTPAAALTHHHYSKPSSNPHQRVSPFVSHLFSFRRHSLLNYAQADAAIQALPDASPAQIVGRSVDGLPSIPASKVRENDGKSGKPIFVTYGRAVYDVTDFVGSHPGGDHILLAAGGPLEPYWSLYAQHKVDWVFEILEELRIGNLEVDEKWVSEVENVRHVSKEGPYANEPDRHPALLVQGETPFNAEPRADLLGATQLTPNDLFYVRNHMPVPVIKEEDYRLEIVGVDGNVLGTFSMKDLKEKFEKRTVAATVQCAGNRRNELDRVKKVKGGRWELGAISNAEWGGVRLGDVLDCIEQQSPGTKTLNKAEHVCFEGLDSDPAKGTVYSASVPVDVLRRVPDVLLAYEMNGETLPRDHGYPIRAVVPGVVGARNVKWLGKVVLSEEECDSHWQKQDYRSFSPDVDWDNVDFSAAPSIQEMPVTSSICAHSVNPDDNTVTIGGYAWSGDGKGIIRVDVSADGGKTWTGAELRDKEREEKRNEVYDWTLWTANVALPTEGKKELVCKAIDSAYNTQPDSVEAIWNLRGLLNNSWHRVELDE